MQHAYIVQNAKQLALFNAYFDLAGTDNEMLCYPALYITMFDDFVPMRTDRIKEYQKLGYKITQIQKGKDDIWQLNLKN